MGPLGAQDTCRGMSQENVDAFRAGLDEEIEFIPLTALLDGVTYRGKDRVRRWMDDLRRDWEIYEITSRRCAT